METAISIIILAAALAVLLYVYSHRRRQTEKQETPAEPAVEPEPTVAQMEKQTFREQLLKEVGVEIKKDLQDGTYWAGYQGGTFILYFGETNTFIGLIFPNFAEFGYEQRTRVLHVVNEVGMEHIWNCYITDGRRKDESSYVMVNLSYRLILHGTVRQVAEALRYLFSTAFETSRDFQDKMKEELEETESVEERDTNFAFLSNLNSAQCRRAAGHTPAEPGEERPSSDSLTIGAIANLFQDSEFGCLKGMRIIEGEEVRSVTDADEIRRFSLREYVRSHPRRMEIEGFTLIVEFERQHLIVDLRRAEGCTDKTLFFCTSIWRSGNILEYEIREAAFSSSFRVMVEIRLTTENEDFWEAKYKIDEALDKWDTNQADELTDEQRLIVCCVAPSVNKDLYWGKKYYNRHCFLQALPHFMRVLCYLRGQYYSLPPEQKELYREICFYIGSLYMAMSMSERAYYYLHISQRSGNLAATREFIDCLCDINDADALVYIREMRDKAVRIMNESDGEEPNEPLIEFYHFATRRMVGALIDANRWEEAENFCHEMILKGEDVDFAKEELAYIRTRRHEGRREAAKSAKGAADASDNLPT